MLYYCGQVSLRLDEQFFSGAVEIFFRKDNSAHPLKNLPIRLYETKSCYGHSFGLQLGSVELGCITVRLQMDGDIG